MSDWVWVRFDAVLAIHDDLLAEYGGADGVRDLGGLESALNRPVNLAAYGNADAADLAAMYTVGVAKAHAFVEGNKRTAWAVGRLFLRLNGWTLDVAGIKAVAVMVSVASSDMSIEALADWFRRYMAPIPCPSAP